MYEYNSAWAYTVVHVVDESKDCSKQEQLAIVVQNVVEAVDNS